MNELDQYLQQLGIKDPNYLAELKQQILEYAFELAVSRLTDLGESDKLVLQQIQQSGQLDDASLAKLFATENRQTVLQAAVAEALKLTAEAATF